MRSIDFNNTISERWADHIWCSGQWRGGRVGRSETGMSGHRKQDQ